MDDEYKSKELSFSNNKERDDTKISFDEFHNIVIKECQSPDIQSIPLDIYQKIATTINRLKIQTLNEVEQEIVSNLILLIANGSKLLLEKRIDKIIMIQNAKKKSENNVNIESSNKELEYFKLTDEEKYVLEGYNDTGKRMDMILNSISGGRPIQLEKISSKIKNQKTIVMFLRSIDSFVGVDMKRYGPYDKEDVTILPLENARALIENKNAIEIDQN